jgi:hypothetical protein
MFSLLPFVIVNLRMEVLARMSPNPGDRTVREWVQYSAPQRVRIVCRMGFGGDLPAPRYTVHGSVAVQFA